jgi:adenylate kinase family enzyme
MQRIMILGPPGSGKSTLARQLGAQHGLPVFHLDQAFWQSGWVEAPPHAFRAAVERVAAMPGWVIDGNYTDTIEPRFRAADAVIYLDVPSWLSVLRILRRMLVHYGRVRADAAPGCPERFDWPFLRFAWAWNRERRTRTLALVESFGGEKIIYRGRRRRAVQWPPPRRQAWDRHNQPAGQGRPNA